MRHRHALLHYRATRKHGSISPCAGKTWAECYTRTNGRLTLWYNTPDGSTHIIQERITMTYSQLIEHMHEYRMERMTSTEMAAAIHIWQRGGAR